jgi:2-desacetyl-2-hydroxyethyl bacteriochlorophyllide A dehydrogenase
VPSEPLRARVIQWPRTGVVEVVGGLPLRQPGRDDVVVDVAVSVTSTGTEIARFRSLPNALVGYPHTPGYMAAGVVAACPSSKIAGAAVAIRGVPHQSRAVMCRDDVHALPSGVPLLDGALWELGVTALHGLRRGEYQTGQPLAILGAGILGAIVRRLALAMGTTECLVVATTEAKEWTVRSDAGARFVASSTGSLTDERGAYPLVVDATGAASGLSTAVCLARDHGRVVILGSPRAQFSPLPARDMQDRGVRVIGAHIATLRQLVERGAVHAERDLTETYFRLLAGGVSFVDLIRSHAPTEAANVYDALAHDQSFIAAAFDWTADA